MAFMGAVRRAPARNPVFVPIARFSAEMCVFYDYAKAVNCLELVMPAVTSALAARIQNPFWDRD